MNLFKQIADLCLRNWGQHPRARSFFVRGIGIVYLVAILSWWIQVPILIGESGIVPLHQFLDNISKYAAEHDSLSQGLLAPTLFWIVGASDAAIHVLCGTGCLLAIFVIMGRCAGLSLLGLYGIYLSLQTTGNVFMSFQWDILLLELGVVAIFLAPLCRTISWKKPSALAPVHRLALLLLWVAMAKMMFQSGWVKLAWASDSQPEWWPEHTAMTYHYMTQPLPTWTAWWAHQLPAWFHKFTIWPMYFVELILPLFIFLGRRLRLIAALGFITLMLLIIATGNYTYFNWLTIVGSLALIADRYWPKKILRFLRIEERTENSSTETISRKHRVSAVSALCFTSPILILLLLLQIHVLLRDFHRAPNPLLANDWTPAWMDKLAADTQPFLLVSGYGLFRTMTITRPEIILEGSPDGLRWKSYDFKWKPDRLDERPRFVAPHQPRIAWQLWFAALEGRYHANSRNALWFQNLLFQIFEGKTPVQDLFVENPFPKKPPRFLRAKLYRYEFTNWETRKGSKNWWKRVAIGDYLPTVEYRPHTKK